MTITERVKNLTDWILRRDGMLKHAGLQELIEKELKELETKSRIDEREKCIERAQSGICNACVFQTKDGKSCMDKCHQFHAIREAIEKK